MSDTRRKREGKAYKTFRPLWELYEQIAQNAVDSVKGQPVITWTGEVMNAGDALANIARVFSRIDSSMDVIPIVKMAVRLDKSVPLDDDLLNNFKTALKHCESVFKQLPLSQIKAALLTEQIAIEVEDMGLST